MKELFLDDNQLGSLSEPKDKNQQSCLEMYKAIRDKTCYSNLKKSLNETYNKYFEFLGDGEEKFKKQAVQNIEAVIWHLGLLKCLAEELHFIPKTNKSHGPDIICKKESIRCLIETTVSSVGQNYSNPSYGPEHLRMGPRDHNEVKLRLTTSLDEKALKIKKYCDQNIIQKDDVVIVAINSCRVFESRFAK